MYLNNQGDDEDRQHLVNLMTHAQSCILHGYRADKDIGHRNLKTIAQSLVPNDVIGSPLGDDGYSIMCQPLGGHSGIHGHALHYVGDLDFDISGEVWVSCMHHIKRGTTDRFTVHDVDFKAVMATHAKTIMHMAGHVPQDMAEVLDFMDVYPDESADTLEELTV